MRHLGPGFSLISSLYSLLQACIQGILLLHQPLQLCYLPLNDSHFLLHSPTFVRPGPA